jgi:hypothetical protein
VVNGRWLFAASVLTLGLTTVAPVVHVAQAQRAGDATVGAWRASASGESSAGIAEGRGALRMRGPALGEAERRRWAPVASLLIPGAGQALLRQDRFVAYLALEAWAVLEFSNQRTEARRQQDRYRALARDVARALYGPSYPVGTWAYYESMEHYLESGVFDRVPGGDVDPDLDESTFNGAMWLLARTTFWTDPTLAPSTASGEYRRAINFYLDRAVRPEYRWSWRNAQLEQDLYVRTIRRSNTSSRGARAALGAVIANHLLSSVDGFITLRVEGLDGVGGSGVALRGTLPIR